MKTATEIMNKLKLKSSALTYCQLKMYQKDITKNEIDYWNKVRQYIYKCYQLIFLYICT